MAAPTVQTVVVKRDDTLADFNTGIIKIAIRSAFESVNVSFNDTLLDDIVSEVTLSVCESAIVTVEQIQDTVERTLMARKDLYLVAKHYISYRALRNEERKRVGFKIKTSETLQPPFGPLGLITFKRTYARELNGGPQTEEFSDTIKRVLQACQTQLRVQFTSAELEEAYTLFMNLKGTVSGRFLWQLGTETVSRFGMMSLQNCAFCAIDQPIRPFLWVFDSLMLGVGVGCGIQRKHVNKLPRLRDEYISVTRKDTADADFIIPDSREGWVSFLGHVLRAFFETGESFTYSTVLIRPAGRPIKGFGGVASGAENLCSGLRDIVNILNKARGRKLSSVECMDIIDIIASIVVSGNVRRSAIIMIGDYDDIEYLNAKRWDLGGIPNWRAMSNNSIDVSDTTQIPPEFWEGYYGNGEPYGLVNLDLCRRVGRLADGGKYPDPEVEGFNPCAEIPLAPWQTCCLAEIFLPNIQTPEELERTAILLYRICKHSLSLDCHQRETLRAVRKDYRIGIGITGYLQSTSEQQSWLSDLYVSLRKYDKMYSRKHGLPESIKLTTVKPSGTLSLLAGVTPGCHPGLFKYFIRRIRVSTNNLLVQTCKKAGYATEFQRRFDGTPDTSTTIIEFPCSYPDSAVLAKDTTAIDQLEIVKRLQTEWSDNAVSCTVYYRPHELDSIKEWLAANYTNSVKSVSFLLHTDHGFDQAPYSEISKDEYDTLISKVTPIQTQFGESLVVDGDDTLDSFECAKGMCPVK